MSVSLLDDPKNPGINRQSSKQTMPANNFYQFILGYFYHRGIRFGDAGLAAATTS